MVEMGQALLWKSIGTEQCRLLQRRRDAHLFVQSMVELGQRRVSIALFQCEPPQQIMNVLLASGVAGEVGVDQRRVQQTAQRGVCQLGTGRIRYLVHSALEPADEQASRVACGTQCKPCCVERVSIDVAHLALGAKQVERQLHLVGRLGQGRVQARHREIGAPAGHFDLGGVGLGARRLGIQTRPKQGLVVVVAPQAGPGMRHRAQTCQDQRGQHQLAYENGSGCRRGRRFLGSFGMACASANMHTARPQGQGPEHQHGRQIIAMLEIQLQRHGAGFQ